MKKDKKMNVDKFYIDTKTQKGVYATGFKIKINGNVALIDFGFDTPENVTTIVSRIIMPLEVLNALEGKINEKENGTQKTSTKK